MEKVRARKMRRMPKEPVEEMKPVESKLRSFQNSFKQTPFSIKEQIAKETAKKMSKNVLDNMINKHKTFS
jgi:hypothetical protein